MQSATIRETYHEQQPGVGHEDVNLAPLVHRRLDHGLDVGHLARVALDGQHVVRTELRDERLCGRCVRGVVDGDVCAALDQRCRDGAPDALCAAGDEGDLAGEC